MIFARFQLWPLAVLMVLFAAIFVGVHVHRLRSTMPLFHTSIFPFGFRQMTRMRLVLRALAVGLWTLALLGPSWGLQSQLEKRVHKDVVFALDYSRSMLAKDLAPSRLVRMRSLVRELMDTYDGYRYSLIMFAGSAYWRIPFTYDRGFVAQIVDETEPQDISPQGTDLLAPLRVVLDNPTLANEQPTIILMTDGEHTGEDPVEPVTQELRASGVRLITVAVGTEAGANIPTANGRPLRDGDGNPVVSRPDRVLLQYIADQTDGVAVVADQVQAADLKHAFDTIRAKETDEVMVSNLKDRSVPFIALGWIALVFSFLPVGLMDRRKAILPLTLVLFTLPAGCADVGSQALEEQQWSTATQYYMDQLASHQDAIASHNLGIALYRAEAYPQALSSASIAATLETEAVAKGDAFYNGGNAAFRSGDFYRALQMYKFALRERDDEDTRVNMEVTKRKIAELQQQAQQTAQLQSQQKQQAQQDGRGQQGQPEKQQDGSDPNDPNGQKQNASGQQPPEDSEKSTDEQNQVANQTDPETNHNDDEESGDSPGENETADDDTESDSSASRAAKDNKDNKEETQQTDDGNQPNALLHRRVDNLRESNSLRMKGGSGDMEKAW